MDMNDYLPQYKIRERHRICASPKQGLRQSWDEFQVILGQRIMARFDFREQAEIWIAEKIKALGPELDD